MCASCVSPKSYNYIVVSKYDFSFVINNHFIVRWFRLQNKNFHSLSNWCVDKENETINSLWLTRNGTFIRQLLGKYIQRQRQQQSCSSKWNRINFFLLFYFLKSQEFIKFLSKKTYIHIVWEEKRCWSVWMVVHTLHCQNKHMRRFFVV